MYSHRVAALGLRSELTADISMARLKASGRLPGSYFYSQLKHTSVKKKIHPGHLEINRDERYFDPSVAVAGEGVGAFRKAT